MHYNPFHYIRSTAREQDILKLVEVFIANTTGEQKGGDEFGVKSEKLLYTAYISLILIMFPDEEHNFGTLIDLISISEVREDDESFRNAVDWSFYYLEKWINDDWSDDEEFEDKNKDYQSMRECEPEQWRVELGRFAVSQYKQYKLAAGKTAKSILISCATRLAPFSIDKVREITSSDEMHLDEIGDRLTALFIIISDTDDTFNFLVGMMYSQLFNLLCEKADNNPNGSGKLTVPVRCLIDEFANIKQIPNFEKLIATIRSRQISASIILQNKAQLKANYKDNADTIEGNCDTKLFLGGTEKATLKKLSENLGKETIDLMTTSQSRGQSESYTVNYQRTGRELMSTEQLAVLDNEYCICQIRGLHPFKSKKFDITKHKRYSMLLDSNPKNFFDIEDYIKRYRERVNQCQMKLSKDTVVEQHKINI